MKEKNIENKKKCFLETVVNYGIVVRGNLDAIEQLKRDLVDNPNIDVIYQRYSFSKLYITENGDSHDQQ